MGVELHVMSPTSAWSGVVIFMLQPLIFPWKEYALSVRLKVS